MPKQSAAPESMLHHAAQEALMMRKRRMAASGTCLKGVQHRQVSEVACGTTDRDTPLTRCRRSSIRSASSFPLLDMLPSHLIHPAQHDDLPHDDLPPNVGRNPADLFGSGVIDGGTKRRNFESSA